MYFSYKYLHNIKNYTKKHIVCNDIHQELFTYTFIYYLHNIFYTYIILLKQKHSWIYRLTPLALACKSQGV